MPETPVASFIPSSIYTRSERTEYNYTVGHAIASARRELAASRRQHGESICANAIGGRALTDKITLEQLNELKDAIVADTVQYSHPKPTNRAVAKR